jgi:hypothetical protein
MENFQNGNPWVDDAFRLEELKWGAWCSFDKMENRLVVSPTLYDCILATRYYLKLKQEGNHVR